MDIEYIVENWRRIPTVLYRKVIIENHFRLRRMFGFFYSSPELRAWNSLKNRHQGETLVVVGNGPSLAAIDFKLLSKFTTFGSNKIFLQDQWVPTYYSVEDDLVMVQNEKSIREFGGTTKLFPCSMLSICSRIPNSIYFEFSTKKFVHGKPSFISEDSPFPSWGSTIVYTQIQLAVWMGAARIILVGVDFNFTLPDGSKNSKKELVSEGEVNHFHPDYRKIGEKWNIPNLDLQRRSFQKAVDSCRERGVELINATPGSKLDVIERIPPDKLGLA